MEILAEYLSIKQFVIILLVDVFQFTAKETAGMIKDSESNVHTTLHRSRKKLNRYAHLSPDETSKFYKLNQSSKQSMTSNLFESFMKGFQSKSVNLIYEAYFKILGTRNSDRKNKQRQNIDLFSFYRSGWKCFYGLSAFGLIFSIYDVRFLMTYPFIK